jgi:hypothetical protein
LCAVIHDIHTDHKSDEGIQTDSMKAKAQNVHKWNIQTPTQIKISVFWYVGYYCIFK